MVIARLHVGHSFFYAQSCLDTVLAETVPVPSGVVHVSTKRSWSNTILNQCCHFCRYDSVGNNHPTNSGVLFKWLHKEHSSSADPYNIGITNWRVDLGGPPTTFVPRQDNSYDRGVFVVLYAAYIDIQKPFTFTQADIDNVRMWMVHLVDEEGKTYNGGNQREKSEWLADFEDLSRHSATSHRRATSTCG